MLIISHYEEYYDILKNLEENISDTREKKKKRKKNPRQLLSSGKTKDCTEKKV